MTDCRLIPMGIKVCGNIRSAKPRDCNLWFEEFFVSAGASPSPVFETGFTISMNGRLFSPIATLTLVAALLFLPGCSSEDNGASQIAAVNSSNIQKLTNLYSAFQTNRYGPGPKSEGEFKRFIKEEMGPYHLELMHVDPNNIDAVFISERDHKPFKVRYGVNGGPGIVNPVVFEEEGIGGKKQVGINGAKVVEVDDAQYKEMWEGHWHPPEQPTAQLTMPNYPPTGPSADGKNASK